MAAGGRRYEWAFEALPEALPTDAEELSLVGTDCRSIVALGAALSSPSLTTVRLMSHGSLRSLDGIGVALHITHLICPSNRIGSPLAKQTLSLPALVALNLAGNELTSLPTSAELDAPMLADLDVADNALTDLAGVGRLAALTKINLSGNRLASPAVLSKLARLPRLAHLALADPHARATRSRGIRRMSTFLDGLRVAESRVATARDAHLAAEREFAATRAAAVDSARRAASAAAIRARAATNAHDRACRVLDAEWTALVSAVTDATAALDAEYAAAAAAASARLASAEAQLASLGPRYTEAFSALDTAMADARAAIDARTRALTSHAAHAARLDIRTLAGGALVPLPLASPAGAALSALVADLAPGYKLAIHAAYEASATPAMASAEYPPGLSYVVCAKVDDALLSTGNVGETACSKTDTLLAALDTVTIEPGRPVYIGILDGGGSLRFLIHLGAPFDLAESRLTSDVVVDAAASAQKLLDEALDILASYASSASTSYPRSLSPSAAAALRAALCADSSASGNQDRLSPIWGHVSQAN
ncbi:uncharacterized protein AMSG_03396 [Thecamonas trahens ATCC 50062]|uniref:Uncharacterized protein n=1 Tax=Thecamonas trahens ATCC 50062 TaxID=461836 RepID=A0A0L0D6N1_THETB|nr:hypothetical protein AMSG_03396 [Thecamonas trahens ATCC 50062]KNC46963.1 hypothetical protein AMSG_03396 [Thecamonas trahens ATCC 50062]|eukprot:XP_013760234.1 hypothetical protein AMSG_03396 [Thecamonas trahens ATCC 50062]